MITDPQTPADALLTNILNGALVGVPPSGLQALAPFGALMVKLADRAEKTSREATARAVELADRAERTSREAAELAVKLADRADVTAHQLALEASRLTKWLIGYTVFLGVATIVLVVLTAALVVKS
jgi:hypothetical protein